MQEILYCSKVRVAGIGRRRFFAAPRQLLHLQTVPHSSQMQPDLALRASRVSHPPRSSSCPQPTLHYLILASHLPLPSLDLCYLTHMHRSCQVWTLEPTNNYSPQTTALIIGWICGTLQHFMMIRSSGPQMMLGSQTALQVSLTRILSRSLTSTSSSPPLPCLRHPQDPYHL